MACSVAWHYLKGCKDGYSGHYGGSELGQQLGLDVVRHRHAPPRLQCFHEPIHCHVLVAIFQQDLCASRTFHYEIDVSMAFLVSSRTSLLQGCKLSWEVPET